MLPDIISMKKFFILLPNSQYSIYINKKTLKKRMIKFTNKINKNEMINIFFNLFRPFK